MRSLFMICSSISTANALLPAQVTSLLKFMIIARKKRYYITFNTSFRNGLKLVASKSMMVLFGKSVSEV